MSATRSALVSAAALCGEVQGSSMTLLWLLVVVVIAGLSKVLWCRRRLRELASRIPGLPGPSLPLLGDVLKFKGDGVSAMLMARDALSRHGSTFRVWLGPMLWVFITDPEDARIILTSKRFPNHDVMVMKTVQAYLGNGVFTSRDETWKKHRKILNHAFHTKSLEQFVVIFAKVSKELVRRLESFGDGNTIDVYPFVGLCNLDISHRTILGIDKQLQLQGECRLFEVINEGMSLVRERMFMPWLLFDWVFKLTKQGKKEKEVLGIFHDNIGGLVNQKIHKYKNRCKEAHQTGSENEITPFIDMLLEISESQGHVLTQTQIRDQTYTIFLGSQDTVSITNSFALILLGLYPDLQEKVVQELNAIFGQDEDRLVTMEDLRRMEYLERVIKETIRLFPAGPLTLREIHEEVKLNTCTLPAGCTAAIFIFGTHRDPRIYPEPDRFDPDRFLPDRVQNRHPCSFLGFTAGPRMCLGYRYAMLSMKTMLSTVLRRYRVFPACSRQDLERLRIGLTLQPVCGFPIKILPRQTVSRESLD